MNVKLLRELIFDFDGVFVNPYKNLIVELIAVAQSFGILGPPMEKIKKHWGEGLEEFLENVLPGINRQAFLQRSMELGFRKTAPPRILGVRRNLTLLSKHYSLSIVSNRGESSLKAIMTEVEIDIGLFRFIHTGTDLPREYHKPNPKAFSRIILILESEGINKEEILYIGDNKIDFEAATGAGINFVAVTSGGPTTMDDFLDIGVPEEHILDSIRDLPKFLGIPEKQEE